LYVNDIRRLLILMEVSKSALLVPILHLEIRALPSKRSFHPLIKKCVIIHKAQACNLSSAWSHVFENKNLFPVARGSFGLEKAGRLEADLFCLQSSVRSLTDCYYNRNTEKERGM